MMYSQSQRWKSFWCIVVCCVVLLILYLSIDSHRCEFRTFPRVNQKLVPFYNRSNTAPKRILLWNSFFDDPKWGLPFDFVNEAFFEAQMCSATKCTINTHTENIQNISEFDAILFHTVLPLDLEYRYPPERSPHQLYIFVSAEAPMNTKHITRSENNFYNLTMTYRLDSDIVNAYGEVQDIETGVVVAPHENPSWKEPSKKFQLDPEMEELITGKHKMVVWFVSNCGAISKRDELAKALEKYVSLDVYGECGNMKCPRNSKECDDKLNKEYKFYLAFENSLCTDYVTEKLFKSLQLTIVPIVFGGANYDKFAPPYSYINAEDYRTPKKLAQYLLYLDRSPQEYRKYFWWKKIYQVYLPSRFTFICKLCEKLFEPTLSTKVQYYKDIEEWLFAGECRLESKILF